MVHRLRETKVLRHKCVIDGSFGAGKLAEATDIYEKWQEKMPKFVLK